METPGLGIKDFVNDVGSIVQNRSGRSRRARRRITRKKNSTRVASGLYHQPGTASVLSSQYDVAGVNNGSADFDSNDEDRIDSFSLDDDQTSDDSMEAQNQGVRFVKVATKNGPSHDNGADRKTSTLTEAKVKNDEQDSDLEML